MTAPVRAIVGHADLGESEQSWRDFLTARLMYKMLAYIFRDTEVRAA